MTNRLFLFLSLFFLFQACSNDFSKEKSAIENNSDSTTQIIQTLKKDTFTKRKNVKPDIIEIHIFQKGETLWDLCKKHYGNRHYSSILSVYNKIQNVNQIESGTKIKIPPLTKILTDENFGLVPPLEKKLFKILAARKLYVEIEKTLWDLRRASNWKGKQNLPKNIIENLEKAADLIDLTISQLNKPKENTTKIPKQMIANLKSVSRNLKNLASGSNDGYGYDLDMIHQDLIRAVHSGRAWVKNNY
jgi:LysM domain